MMKKTNRKYKRIIALLFMLSILVTTGTFAFWATSIEGTSSDATGTLTVGYAEGVETVFELTNTLQDGGLLVPVGQAINSGDNAVEEINVSYNLLWKEDTTQSQLAGTTTNGDISVTHQLLIESDGIILDSTEYSDIYDLIQVNYNENNPTSLVLDGDVELFSFNITMNEPNNQQDYSLISNSEISILFNYSIINNFIETTNVIDGPYFSLIGDNVVYVELSSTYVDEGVIAYNSLGEEIATTWFTGEINTWQVGTYIIEYSAYSNYDNQIVPATARTIVVIDTTAPVVTISGPDTLTLSVGDSYSDWGAYAYDTSNTHSAVTKVGTVDTSVQGTYIVTYYSTDASGNTGEAVKTIIVN